LLLIATVIVVCQPLTRHLHVIRTSLVCVSLEVFRGVSRKDRRDEREANFAESNRPVVCTVAVTCQHKSVFVNVV